MDTNSTWQNTLTIFNCKWSCNTDPSPLPPKKKRIKINLCPSLIYWKQLLKYFWLKILLKWWTCRYTRLKDWKQKQTKKTENLIFFTHYFCVCGSKYILYNNFALWCIFNSLCSWNSLTWKCLLSHYAR